MGRPRKTTTVRFEYRGVIIFLYPNVRGSWEAGFTVHGRKRGKATGPTEVECRQNACAKIRSALSVEEIASKNDEEAARRLLEEHGVSLAEAAKFWRSQHSHSLFRATIEDLRTTWLAYRRSRKGKKQYHHLRALEQRSKHLLPKFGAREIASINVAELTLWQDGLEATNAARTVRNIHDAAKDLWRFARKRGFLAMDRLSAMEQVDRPRSGTSKREVFLPDEMQLLLDAAWGFASPAAPALAVNAFGSARAEELCCQYLEAPPEFRIWWEDAKWEDGYIDVRPEVSKTGEQRKAGLPDNLRIMLLPLKGTGPLFSKSRLDLDYHKIAKVAGVKWKYNALRHSCITYDMLLAHNATEVASKAGNSVAMIEASYRNRNASKQQAEQWFQLRPRVAWGSLLSQLKDRRN